KERLLVVEDDTDIRELMRHTMVREGYEVTATPQGEEGLKLAQQGNFDLILLDLMLPGISGLDVCKTVRSNPALRRTGILIITAKDEEVDVVTGLELGADDYLVKPFSVRVLLARVRALLRRASEANIDVDDTPMVHGPLRIDVVRHEVSVKDSHVELTLA